MPTRHLMAAVLVGLLSAAVWFHGDNSPASEVQATEEAPQQREIEQLRAEVARLQSLLRKKKAAPAAPAGRDYSDTYYIYSGAYPTTAAGVTKLPPNMVWEAVPSDGGGLDPADPRIMMRLHDHSRSFLAVTAQMNVVTAMKLHNDLGQMIQARLKSHPPGRLPQ